MKKTGKKWLGVVALGLAAALLLALPGQERTGESDEVLPSVLHCAAERRDMERTLRSGGALSGGETSRVTVPAGVRITALRVQNGDMVEKGDELAAVDKVSVMSAVREIQQKLEEIQESMNALYLTPGTLTADESGVLYANGKKVAEEDYGDYATYMTLADEHRAAEETLLTLFQLYYSGAVTAPEGGLVDGLDKSVVQSLRAGSSTARVELLAHNTPYGDDGESYLSFVGLVETAGEDGSLEMRINPNALALEDFDDLSAVDTSLDAMTARGTYPGGAPLFAKADGAWSNAAGAESGDLLLFTYDGSGSIVWVIKLGRAGDWEADPSPSPNPGEDPDPGENPGGEGEVPGGGGGIPAGGWSGALGTGGGEQQEQQSQSAEDTLLCSVVPLDEMTVTLTVDEQDIARLSEGMTAQVTVDALPGQSFTGTVTELSKFGSNNGGSSKFTVQLTLPWAEGMLPGMNASATFTLERRKDVLALPVAALTDQGRSTVVYTGYEEESGTFTNPTELETGWSDGEWAEILSGLEEGQEVYYEYYDQLVLSTEARDSSSPWG